MLSPATCLKSVGLIEPSCTAEAMADDQGASPAELVLEAARRNNTDLLYDVIKQLDDSTRNQNTKQSIAQVLNHARDGIGMGAIHLAALNGNYEVLDLILDQEGVEIDELDRLEKDTPLHKAVRYTNSLDQTDWAVGHQIVDILIDAGCDPRIRNGAKLRPFDLADPRNKDLRTMLQKAEYCMHVSDDIIREQSDDSGDYSDTDSD